MKRTLISTLIIIGGLFNVNESAAQVLRAIITGPETAKIIYQSHQGITYGELAEKFGVTNWKELEKINGYSERKIPIGKELKIPVSIEVAEPYILTDKNQLAEMTEEKPPPETVIEEQKPLETQPTKELEAIIANQKQEISALNNTLSQERKNLEKMQIEIQEIKEISEQQKEELAKLTTNPPTTIAPPAPKITEQEEKKKSPDPKIMATTIQQMNKEIESLKSTLEEKKTELARKDKQRSFYPNQILTTGIAGLSLLILASLGFGWKTKQLKRHYQTLLFSERVELSVSGKAPHIYIPKKICKEVRPGFKECQYTTLHINPEGKLHRVQNLDEVKSSVQQTLKKYYQQGMLPSDIRKLVDRAFKSNRLGMLQD